MYIFHDQLETVTSAKYLGITLQSNLKWDKHIDDITFCISNGNKTLEFLKCNLKTANQALVLPKLEYSCTV